MKPILLLIFISTISFSQISNVRQKVENGRVIINYDLSGNYDGLTFTVQDAQGKIYTPYAFEPKDDFTPGKDKYIWWEPQLEGLSVSGWKITLTATINYLKLLNIKFIFVEGGPRGDFNISETEVTFAQFDKFCEETGYDKPNDQGWGRGERPVIGVNVEDANKFCNWLSKKTGTVIRLPEEDEWEFAARGGNKSNGYKYSGSDNIDEVAWYYNNSGEKTNEVGTKKPNELGIYDMSGNVWEWAGTKVYVRGGSWGGSSNLCSVSYRYNHSPEARNSDLGFRVLQNSR